MQFIKGNKYKCLHDQIINKELAFKKDYIYDCIDGATLIGNNNNKYIMHEDTNWDYYFVEYKDNVNHPSHYSWLKQKCGIEVIDITRHLDFDTGNAIKYILRAGYKKDSSLSNKQKEIEDLKKAIWYLNDKIKLLEND